ncbi:NADH:flavin oxidoreductase/NADH oxidase [Cylindrobasidium torrendii FP15055 ss-10]|uniref:NADH:flavin oxidoreductase/NADH oxidase n=1 Tax=Cylindrobasidium torrendii FP15055 ss-10 TaxID=1314674 RepID=A0A0D7B8P2_9AGAR|nr:NADH:flavin oxidoreductase/NADH oxidase [Cylindrobasidium torrendii FP15055 ss-10]
MSNLYKPIKLGPLELSHRIVLAPLTRYRATDDHVPLPTVKEYYGQRASIPGTLLITEATYIAAKAGGDSNVPGIWNDAQIAAWKEVTDTVHAKGSYIFLQLWALGRAADPKELRKENPDFPYVSASNIRMKGASLSGAVDEDPKPLTLDEIKEYVALYGQAATNAVHKAGFDGVEIHGANGYLPDQFLQDVSNDRTDAYGGSIENRARFALEITDACVKAVGADRVGYRVSPWSAFQDMRMEEPIPTFAYLATQLKERYPDFGYFHAVEPRVNGNVNREAADHENIQFLRDIWAPKVFISAGGFHKENAEALADAADNNIIAFGRQFLANPDIHRKLVENLPVTKYDRDTFYLRGDNTGRGYTDYPVADELV